MARPARGAASLPAPSNCSDAQPIAASRSAATKPAITAANGASPAFVAMSSTALRTVAGSFSEAVAKAARTKATASLRF